jgi:hypothetical protein
MALETATYINQLVATNPAAADGLVDGDNHIRLIKAALQATFPSVTGAVTPTQTELNFVDGVTSAIQTQLDAKAAKGTNTDLNSVLLANTGLRVKDTDASHSLCLSPGSDLTVDRVLIINTGDANRTLDMSAGSVTVTVAGNAVTSAADLAAQKTLLGCEGTNTGDQLTFKTIAVAGQTDIVAEALSDTLTIAAGGGVTLTTNAATDTLTISAGLTLGTAVNAATGSPTSIDFASLPAGIKRITAMFNGVSTSGTSNLIVQLGDSGGIEITDYTGGTSFDSGSGTGSTAWTSGAIACNEMLAANVVSGAITFTLMTGSTWVAQVGTARHDSRGFGGGGVKALSATLDRVRFTTANGTDTFDAGFVNIAYE